MKNLTKISHTLSNTVMYINTKNIESVVSNGVNNTTIYIKGIAPITVNVPIVLLMNLLNDNSTLNTKLQDFKQHVEYLIDYLITNECGLNADNIMDSIRVCKNDNSMFNMITTISGLDALTVNKAFAKIK